MSIFDTEKRYYIRAYALNMVVSGLTPAEAIESAKIAWRTRQTNLKAIDALLKGEK